MRIVQLCPYDMARPGGVQAHVRALANHAREAGHEVRIIAPPTPGRKPHWGGAGDWTLGRSRVMGAHGTRFEISLAAPWTIRRAAQELRDWGADIVHMHTPWTPLMVWQMWRALELPTVTTIHATLPDPRGAGLVDRYIRQFATHILKRSDGVVVPSDAPLAMLRDLVPNVAARVLPPAVDLGDWSAAAVTRQDPPREVLFLGRLEPRKGLDILQTAWPQVRATLPEARLTVAGDGPLRARVMAAAEAGALDWCGEVDDATARALMGRADLFAAPAPFGESYGLVLAEAMAAGAVPVAAANAGYRLVLGDEAAPLLVPPGDAAALSDRIVALLTDPDELARWRAWGRLRARASDIADVGDDYLGLYAEVLAR